MTSTPLPEPEEDLPVQGAVSEDHAAQNGQGEDAELVVGQADAGQDATADGDADEAAASPLTRLLNGAGEDAMMAGDQRPLAELEAREITAWFGDHMVLDRVSLTMSAGEVTSLIGPSGCGKSTFLRILNRMHQLVPGAAMAGEVLLDGVDIYDPSQRLTQARREIGMVFQKPNPFPAMSIYENVVAGLKLTGMKVKRDAKDAVVEECLTKAGLWREEPCSALDPTSTRVIEETIAELVQEVTIVIVTHNMQQAARVSQQCAFFLAEHRAPGYIVEYGPTAAMFSDPQDPRTADYVHGRFG